ncbi:hypothetical protein DXB65_16065 [Bacteroides oleiciplenus]|uniref:Uncharacterized protein n=1 Tax=Bacteroides oleiciplenus TaxID=626931 RepID=A0A3E5B6S9_9BACE|nr:hypothetical protein DXB65_16065 [Bacteroides oleiciplenus]
MLALSDFFRKRVQKYIIFQYGSFLVSKFETFLKYKLLYSFKSPKSHQWYWVWVEVYMHNYLKANEGTFTGTLIRFYDLFTTKHYFILL